MMSSAADETDEVCASCGVAEIDNVKLKDCGAGCDLAKYCSDGCQELHRPEHAGECKKRLAELRDRDLFTQPNESHLGECPICCLPLPIDAGKTVINTCCSKIICNGCNHANINREIEAGLEHRCAFCRESMVKLLDNEFDKECMKRIKKNDPAAMSHMGRNCIEKGDYETALKYLTKAAELGNAIAYYNLALLYRKGQVVEKDNEKEIHYLEEAAIRGHPVARHDLGCEEAENGRFERARKHFIIAVNLGDHSSLSNVKRLYAEGHASKEDYADALRAYQTVVNEAKSAEREKAEAYYKVRGTTH
jgi:tetratricopeptide (TPR) repeat protein